jgi:hypothetical protein
MSTSGGLCASSSQRSDCQPRAPPPPNDPTPTPPRRVSEAGPEPRRTDGRHGLRGRNETTVLPPVGGEDPPADASGPARAVAVPPFSLLRAAAGRAAARRGDAYKIFWRLGHGWRCGAGTAALPLSQSQVKSHHAAATSSRPYARRVFPPISCVDAACLDPSCV